MFYKFISKYFLSGCSDYNSLLVRQSCRAKGQGKKAFAKLGVPSAKSALFISPLTAFSFVKKHGFPVVIKPNIGGFSRGAHFPITNYKQLLFASIAVKIWWHKSIIEQYLSGENYRIVVIKERIMSVILRHPPLIVGDGKQTISALIDDENIIREQMGILPIMAYIPKNRAIKQHLSAQNLSLNSVPKQDETIVLHHKIAINLGSVVEIVDKNELSANNKAMLFDILNHFNANILGIDVICTQGLSVDFSNQNCIFLEVNSRPFLSMHDAPRYGEKEDLSDFYRQLDSEQVTN